MENQDNKNNKKDEIISRRKFFKRAAGMVIPAIALTVLPSALTSCEIDEPYPGDIPSGGSGCSGSSCSSGCKGTCRTTCIGECGGSSCSMMCSDSCGNTCHRSCGESCHTGTCKNGCSYGCGGMARF